jgi:hypothetical protein
MPSLFVVLGGLKAAERRYLTSCAGDLTLGIPDVQ